jgi:hypothetical protein
MQPPRMGSPQPNQRSSRLSLAFVQEVVIVPVKSRHRYSLSAQRTAVTLAMQAMRWLRSSRTIRKRSHRIYERVGRPRLLLWRQRADALNIQPSFGTPAARVFRNRGAKLLVKPERVLRQLLCPEGRSAILPVLSLYSRTVVRLTQSTRLSPRSLSKGNLGG